jgi:hypothetical protein
VERKDVAANLHHRHIDFRLQAHIKRQYVEDKMAKEKWIQKAIKKPGALKKALHVKEDEKIPTAKLKKAEHSKNPLMRKRAALAETLGKLRKKK